MASKKTTTIRVKRIYDPSSSSDGRRILVDRLWPRGVARARAGVDLWAKEIAPSTELRRWYSHEVEKWPEFKLRYNSELERNHSAVESLIREVRKDPTVCLLFGARETKRNNAIVLKDFLEERID